MLKPGALEECSAWDDDTLCRLSQFQIDIISLTATDIVRTFACKHQVRTEFTVANYSQQKKLYDENLIAKEDYLKAKEDYELATKKYDLVVERLRPRLNTVDIMFVDHRFHLIVGKVVDLADL